ncbi:MAG: ISKra4 family transposase [Actinomycetota bacterium]|nr:ISKra4 family transposase [Actinomycetota bacterium]
MELAIRAAMLHVGASFLEQLLSSDTGYVGPRVDCGAGHQAEFVSVREKGFGTALGRARLPRAYYYCSDCHAGVVPRDEQLGLAGTSLSPGLRAMADRVGAAVPFAKGATLLSELAGVDLGAKAIERVAESDGQALSGIASAEAAGVAAGSLVLLGPAEAPRKLYIVMDGTGVPMVASCTAGRPGKSPDGRAATREAKLAVLFTQSRLDAEGYAVRDESSSTYVGTFEPAEGFALLVQAEAMRRGVTSAGSVVVLGDGAPWIWAIADDYFPEATQVVDLYHARQHLHGLGALVAPALGGTSAPWLKDRLDELDAGQVGALATAVRELALPGELACEAEKALGYFETNVERMRYAEFRALGHFVGSGTVEAGCKSVIAQRLKLSGMRWRVSPGATGIMTLRCEETSGRWDEICQRLRTQTRVA